MALPSRSALTVAVVAAVFLLGSTRSMSVSAQGDYVGLIGRYVDDADDAIGTLAKWTTPAAGAAVDAHSASLSPQQRVTAAMLHADLASVIVDSDPTRAAFHIGLGRRLLDAVQNRSEFVQRWYEFIAMLYVSRGRFEDAMAFATNGLMKYPGAATLYGVRGTVAELRVTFDYPNLRGEPITDDRANFRASRALEAAAADYRRALALNSRFVIARLRLGWIHLLLRDKRAVSDLTTVLRDTADDSIGYLAHLFLGAIAEREGRFADARRAYEGARAAGAGYQSACVALSHLEAAMGQSTRARAIAQECVTLLRDGDPWWRLGVHDPRTLDWLRAEARRR